MNIAEIESELQDLVDKPFDPAAFVFRFLEIYDAPKATVTKLKQGSGNHADEPRDLLWKNKLFFRIAGKGKAASAVDAMRADPLVKKHHPRFLFATDGEDVYCRDIKADQTIDLSFQKLNDQFLFFLPLANIERYEAPAENPADIKATGRVAKLYDAILEANGDWIERDYTHDLNQFMTRLLFCFFAEDTSIFEKDIFTSTVMNLTQEDGSDTAAVLGAVFEAMNTKQEERQNLPEYARRFPYVNGGLFQDKTKVPKFSKRARRLLKECGELYWKEINPDIFGSMIQAVAQPGLREDMGLHYTSVPNIMKVLQPLFLLSLEEEFEAARASEAKLKKLLQRIYNIRVFDPACGSGNFLIIAYKELRKLEMRVFERQKQIARQWSLPMTEVKLTQFYGIELTDFASETAKLSLWIAEYQMNELFKATFGKAPPALPLRDSGNIIHGNANRVDWLAVCPPLASGETYIVGNPPYLGRAKQTEIANIFSTHVKSYKRLDYVACWTAKGAFYCSQTPAKCALVTTNSICQGEQVGLLWPLVLKLDLEIGFAHQSFKWRNSAAKNAGVTCIIVGIRQRSSEKKILYSEDIAQSVKNISPYLLDRDDLIVTAVSNARSKRVTMKFGNMPADGGHLLLSPAEKSELVEQCPAAVGLLRRVYGSNELIKGLERWCLWIDDDQLVLADSMPPVAKRVAQSKAMRLKSIDAGTKSLANRPHQFRDRNVASDHLLAIPKVSSERRRYLPVAMLPAEAIVTDLLFAIYDGPEYLMAVLSSRLHIVWAMAVGGQHETRLRYSNTLIYNTFPIPDLSDAQKSTLEDHVIEILAAREAHPGKTLAWLYDGETMPANLSEAHKALDETIETIYIGRPFRGDSERLENLFDRYATGLKKGKPAKQLARQELSQGAS
jgi:hypothetical protein